MTTDHTPRDTAERLINHSRKARPIDLAGIGNVATAAAILDLADAIRESHAPPLVEYAELDEDDTPAPEPCTVDGCVLFDGHAGDHSPTRPPIEIPHMTTVRGGPRYHHAILDDGTVIPQQAQAPTAGPFVAITVDETPHAAVRDPERTERIDHIDPAWRIRALAGKVRRAMSLEPLPVAMTIDELLDDLEANVDELATSRDEARAEWESAGADRRAIADALGVDCHIDAILAAVNPARS